MKKIKWRTLVQIGFFLFVGLVAVNHTLAETGASLSFLSSASVHAICPFGGVVTLYQLFTEGSYIQKIHESAVVLMGIAFFLAVLFGPVICGWICPLGSIQEWVGKIGKRLFKRRYNHFIPEKIDSLLRYTRYIVLALVVYVTATTGLLMFANVDPYYALYHFWTGETAFAAMAILIITLVASLFVERPWCKYACPYGALLGLFNKIRIFKIRRVKNTCTNCKACDHRCPMNIKVSEVEIVNDHQCISCLECTSELSCPVPNTVGMAKLNSKKIAVFTVGILLIGIFSASWLGLWSTTNKKTPTTYESGVAAGTYKAEDIKGSYTFDEVANLYGIDPEVLREAFAVPKETNLKSFKSKDIEVMYASSGQEIGNGSLKAFVALYKGLPLELEDSFLPEPAVKLILENNKTLTEEQKAYLASHTVSQ